MAGEVKEAWSVYCLAFQRWWDLAVEMLLLNIVVVLISFTVVFAPVALFGLFYCTSVMVHGEDYGIGRAFSLAYEGVKKHWFAAYKWFILNLVIFTVLIVNIVYYGTYAAFWALALRSFFIVILLIWLMIQFYAVPYYFEQHDKRLRTALKNGFLTLFAAPVFSFFVCGGMVLLAVVFAGLFVPSFLGGLPLVSFIGCAAVINRIKKYNLRK